MGNTKPDYNMTFNKDCEEIGHLEWNDGVMKFSGNMEESAKLFFEFLKPYMDSYLTMKSKEEQNEKDSR